MNMSIAGLTFPQVDISGNVILWWGTWKRRRLKYSSRPVEPCCEPFTYLSVLFTYLSFFLSLLSHVCVYLLYLSSSLHLAEIQSYDLADMSKASVSAVWGNQPKAKHVGTDRGEGIFILEVGPQSGITDFKQYSSFHHDLLDPLMTKIRNHSYVTWEFFQVQGGLIDKAHHEGNARKAIEETIEFDKAVQKTRELLFELGILNDTLLIVTGGHGHTMSINGYPNRNSTILGD